MTKKKAQKTVGKAKTEAKSLAATLKEMGAAYSADPEKAVRGQIFIKILHGYLGAELNKRLSKSAVERGVTIRYEETVFSSTKPKDMDVIVHDPVNGPLVLVGVRSQMSSVGNNALTYYEGIIGECISLQDRYPMAIHGYVYLHPLKPIKAGKEDQKIDHLRYAKMYAAVTGRSADLYKLQRGVFDAFAYLVVNFETDPPTLVDDVLMDKGIKRELRLSAFVDNIVSGFKERELFVDLFA
jgi:hypothetical protein